VVGFVPDLEVGDGGPAAGDQVTAGAGECCAASIVGGDDPVGPEDAEDEFEAEVPAGGDNAVEGLDTPADFERVPVVRGSELLAERRGREVCRVRLGGG